MPKITSAYMKKSDMTFTIKQLHSKNSLAVRSVFPSRTLFGKITNLP